jgi:predicted kinase
MLIGPPGAGKSTIAQQWIAADPKLVWVSTDLIRQELYGDASIQGTWIEVEAAVMDKIQQSIAQQRSVLYDATNARRAWRLNFLQNVADLEAQWLGWHLKTSLGSCKAQNQLRRDRQVPDHVIEQAFNNLKQFPPCRAEGFIDAQDVPLRYRNLDFEVVQQLIQTCERRCQQKLNKESKNTFHGYSKLVDFERLMYLIALLLRLPGIGQLRSTNPQLLKREINREELPDYHNDLDEVVQLISHKCGEVYADRIAIQADLNWLNANGIVNSIYSNQPIQPPPISPDASIQAIALHATPRYADQSVFLRLMQIIRFLAHHPFAGAEQRSKQKAICKIMEKQGILPFNSRHNFRRDCEEALKPYGILRNEPMNQGYFLGTVILSQAELLTVFRSLEGQAKHLQDPVSLQAYQLFEQRLAALDIDTANVYPVRAILNQPIAASQFLPPEALAQPEQSRFLETAIEQNSYLELKRLSGTGRYPDAKDDSFTALPLQIVYYNVGWYLGYQRYSDGLYQFERLDRLQAKSTSTTQPRSSQVKALNELTQLQQASFGLFLGNNAIDQRAFLNSDPKQRAKVIDTLELWFTEHLFRFISEGTQRLSNVKMSIPSGRNVSTSDRKSIFSLPKTDDLQFPYRFQAKLPIWTINDSLDFRTWILRFGNGVKIISPDSLIQAVQTHAQDILAVYNSSPAP